MSVRILVGDVRERLADLDAGSVQCVVTSPPYFGLRDYGVAGQIGLEPTLAEYIATMVAVFRDVRRVLRDDGTCWLNIGDSYAGSWGAQSRPDGNDIASTLEGSSMLSARQMSAHPRGALTGSRKKTGLKPKDLMMVPARVALALVDDGWYLRSDIIWAKPNPMPESVTDRPTSAHEHIFLLTKRPRYFFDAEAVRTPATAPITKMPDGWDTGPGSHGTIHRNGREKGARVADKQRGHGRRHDGFNDRWDAMEKSEQQANGANVRNVWTIATHPYPEAHFATFPPALAERCIKAGSREGDTVLDPFAGAGTTLLVADRLGRDAVGIELNPSYVAMIEKRIRGDAPMFASVEVA